MSFAASTAQTWRAFRSHHFAAIGVALALTAVVAAGGWQISRGGDGAAAVARRAPSSVTAVREPALIFYLVSSQAAADAVVQAENEAAAIRVRDGDIEPQRVVYAQVVGDGASLDRVVQELAVLSGVRVAAGLGEPRVVDMRTGHAGQP